jgi:DNA-binding Lrp family transcriptional regulator
MDRARIHEGIRRMRVEALLERQEEGALSQVEAAEMLRMSERSFRRWRDRLRDEGAASEEIARMLGFIGSATRTSL